MCGRDTKVRSKRCSDSGIAFAPSWKQKTALRYRCVPYYERQMGVPPMYDYRRMGPEERGEVLQIRRARGFPLHAPPHIYLGPGVYLLSAACYEHKPIFDSPSLLTYLEQTILQTMMSEQIRCDAWIFLPNHYHLLAHLENMECYSEITRKVHARIATKVNGLHGKRGRKVWYRTADRKMRSDAHYWTTISYIHLNAVKHGYVDDPDNWPWSSWRHYLDENGRESLETLSKKFPPLDYGKGWDD